MNDRAANSTIAVLLLVVIAVAMSATGLIVAQNFSEQMPTAQFTLLQLETDTHEQTIHMRNFAGGAIEQDGATVIVTVDGVRTEHGLDEFPELAGGEWRPGTAICIFGPGCLYVHGDHVEVTVQVGGNVLSRTSTYVRAFAINTDGGIEVLCPGDVFIEVVGVQITEGESGPDIPVTVRYTDDNGGSFETLYGGPADAGDLAVRYAEVGDILGVRGTAEKTSGSWSRTYNSYDASDHVSVLIDRDVPPDFKPFGNQTGIEVFMEPYLDSKGLIDLERNQVIILYEFTDDLASPAADYQDLVVLFTFPVEGCQV